MYTMAKESKFGEIILERLDLLSIASIERGEGMQFGGLRR
jgi:hypothetical protein